MVDSMGAREASSAPGQGPFANLTAGIWNVATAPFQLPIAIVEASSQKNVLYGVSAGTLQGLARTGMNFFGGIARVLTAVIPPDPLELVARKMASAPLR